MWPAIRSLESSFKSIIIWSTQRCEVSNMGIIVIALWIRKLKHGPLLPKLSRVLLRATSCHCFCPRGRWPTMNKCSGILRCRQWGTLFRKQFSEYRRHRAVSLAQVWEFRDRDINLGYRVTNHPDFLGTKRFSQYMGFSVLKLGQLKAKWDGW